MRSFSCGGAVVALFRVKCFEEEAPFMSKAEVAHDDVRDAVL